MNRAKRKWASVWRPIATDTMSLEAMTTDPMYTTEVYKSVTVNEDSSEEHKNAAPDQIVIVMPRPLYVKLPGMSRLWSGIRTGQFRPIPI